MKRKIINDPIHSIIKFPFPEIYDLIDHPIFQRLRRIKQMGLSSYVFPGAVHSRFSHALGTAYVMMRSVQLLRSKGVLISDEEYYASLVCALLHDVGHGPFSHALENLLIDNHHEDISVQIMKVLDDEFSGKLALAIQIYSNTYERPFFHELLSGQIDVDRMDYLMRDNYFAGVAEGQIGMDRLIELMNVADDHLVFEIKATASIENFFMSRWLMYKEVYLHKTGLRAECMLKILLYELRANSIETGNPFMDHLLFENELVEVKHAHLESFLQLDDIDVLSMLKRMSLLSIPKVSTISKGLLERRLFPIKLDYNSLKSDFKKDLRPKGVEFNKSLGDYQNGILTGIYEVLFYKSDQKEINILKSDGSVTPFSKTLQNMSWINRNIKLYYRCNSNY